MVAGGASPRKVESDRIRPEVADENSGWFREQRGYSTAPPRLEGNGPCFRGLRFAPPPATVEGPFGASEDQPV